MKQFMILPGAFDPSTWEPSLSGFLADLPECQLVSLRDNDIVSLEGWRLPRSFHPGNGVTRDLQDECTVSLGCDFHTKGFSFTLLTFQLTSFSQESKFLDGSCTCSILADAQLDLGRNPGSPLSDYWLDFFHTFSNLVNLQWYQATEKQKWINPAVFQKHGNLCFKISRLKFRTIMD